MFASADMKLVMDFVPNHTSNKHKWFLASSNPDDLDYEKYKDYYVWVNSTDGTRNGIPNNWVRETYALFCCAFCFINIRYYHSIYIYWANAATACCGGPKLRLRIVQLRAVVSCSHASASPYLVCRDSCVVIVRAFPQ